MDSHYTGFHYQNYSYKTESVNHGVFSSIEMLMNFSTQISDIELSQVIVVLKYRTELGDRGAIFQY